jgi:manganese-dependent inorganic pyrophosphatase
VGTVETASPATIEARIDDLTTMMQHMLQERNYLSFLFMIVDIINMRCHLLIAGGEQAVAETFGRPLEADGHSIIVEGLVSRKKQVVPQLTRIESILAETTNVR